MIESSALLQLHRIHQQLSDLNDRFARGPKQIKAGEQQVARLEADLAAAKDNLKRARVRADEKQLQMRHREASIKDLQVKLNMASGNREYQLLKEQIAADEQANSVLADEILEILEKIDVLHVKVGEAEAALQQGRADLDKIKARVAAERAGLESEIQRCTAELQAAEGQLSPDFRQEYARIARARGVDALAQVDGTVCGGCFTTITHQMVNDLLMSRPVFCKSCGRLLYLPEDRNP